MKLERFEFESSSHHRNAATTSDSRSHFSPLFSGAVIPQASLIYDFLRLFVGLHEL
jgi:hypothetical protein